MSAVSDATDLLSVFMDDVHIGSLYNRAPLSFSYDIAWLDNPEAKPLDPEIPLQTGDIASPYVHAFFENLLPEGDQRRIIGLRHHVSTIFALLAAVGGDTAGSIVLLPSDQKPQPPLYRLMDWNQIDKLIHGGGNNSDATEQTGEEPDDPTKPRLSISGAQYKLLISLNQFGMPLLPMGASPSTHILKPDIVRSDINIFASAVNETIVMRASYICELPTANVSYQSEVKACLVERYDRRKLADGTLQRLWQADLCQLAGKPSDVKYEADGGPSFKECFDLLSAHTVRPAIDQRNLLRWLFFNLYVGNNDSHAKNLSIINTDEGLRLAPFYDLMSTGVYSGLAPHFAFRIGGEFVPGKIGKSHLESLANSLGIKPAYLIKIANDMAEKVERAIPIAIQETMPHLVPAEKIIAENIGLKITHIVQKMRSRLLPTDESNGHK